MSSHPIRNIADIRTIERAGFEALVPETSPFEIIEATASASPSATAIRFLRRVDSPETDLVVTYAEFASRIRQSANLFRRLGVGETDAVAILAPHTPSAQIALWAAEVAGRACPINPMLRPDHVIDLLRASKAKIAVVLGENDELDIWSKLAPALRASDAVKHVLDCDSDRPSSSSDGAFEILSASENAAALDFDIVPDREAIAAFFHTGGTTGAPKLAMHTRGNEAFIGRAAGLMYDLSSTDVVVNGFPLFHVAGALVYGLSVFAAGGSLLIPTRLGMRNRAFMEGVWRQVERYRATIMGCVPTILSSMNAIPVNGDISSMRMALTGGSPLPAELADAFERKVGKPVRNILGMTECSGVITVEPFHGPRVANSTGLPLPFTELRVFRPFPQGDDFAAPMSAGETGVLALRGPHVGPGYTDAARNAGVFEQDGWLVTGDLGSVDHDGRVYVTGRAKDVIIRGAHNIDPAMIEDALLQHPAIAVAAAVGQPDAYAGELPVAYVTLKPGAAATAETLLAFVAPLIAEPAAIPKRIEIISEMPITPVGKIYKPMLRASAAVTAIDVALKHAGLRADQFEVVSNETEHNVELSDPALTETARQALVGMPIKFAVQCVVAERTPL